MRKAAIFLAKHTQQAVMTRVGVLPVMARSGQKAKSGRESSTKKSGSNVFIVGESEVGGLDRVGGVV
jgi:hypothetical protein